MNTAEEVLKASTIEGLVIKLPDIQLDRTIYEGVKKALEGIGGKWNRSAAGFKFKSDPTVQFQRVLNGESPNIQQEYQFFETPDEIADKMVELAEIKPDHMILEPSAGRGALIKAIHRNVDPFHMVYYCELFEDNRRELEKLPLTTYVGDGDFLRLDTSLKFDRIIANPPFTKGQDMQHITKMLDHLTPGGRIVTIASAGWKFSGRKAAFEFREMLYERATLIEDLPAGTFKESGTNVSTTLLVLE